jgi:hypothetical protein
MMELHDRLDRLAGPAVEATTSQADADLARGRRALRRRRTVKGAASGVFAVAAAAAALAYGTASPPASSVHPAAAPRPAVVSTALVAYKGEQPKGYTIDKVPSGSEIQGADPSVLTIAPVDAEDKDPHSFVGKIAIMLQSVDEKGTPTGTAVKVAGKTGVLITPEGQSAGRTLYVKQPTGVNLIVQIWDARGWSNDAIVEFAAGIHVLPDAVQGRG